MKLLTKIGSQPKLVKGDIVTGYLFGGLHLAPHKLSGHNICPNASPGCVHACLNKVGYGRFNKTQTSRIKKTKLFFSDRKLFLSLLYKDLHSLCIRAISLNLRPACRLNLTSDIAWERVAPQLFSDFPMIQFYDYTKDSRRCMRSYKLPANYSLVFSKSETNNRGMRKVLRSGKCNVVVVFHSIPKVYLGRKVVNGDKNDARFLEGKGNIVGVRGKGMKAKFDKSGFVV